MSRWEVFDGYDVIGVYETYEEAETVLDEYLIENPDATTISIQRLDESDD